MENSTTQTKKPFYKSAWFIILSIFVAVILIAIIIFSAVTVGGGNKINWSELELGDKLPVPKKLNGEVLLDNSESLSLTMYKVSEKDFKDYVKECKNAGYTVDIAYESLSSMYEAFNDEGYNLYLSYYSSEESMRIDLTEPATAKMKEFEWPDNDLCSLLPTPKSNFGYFNSNSSNYLSVSIGNTTVEDYEDYVKACQDKGFNVDYYSSDNSFSAKNSNGYSLYVKYAGVNVMDITLNKPYEDTDSNNDDNNTSKPSTVEEKPEETQTPESDNNSSSNDNKLSKDFKEAMDSYEDFMDDYIDFMEKYQDSDGTDLSLLTEYTEYMNKYNQVCEDFKAWDSSDMNSAEAAYYLEVQTRVNQKLLNSLE